MKIVNQSKATFRETAADELKECTMVAGSEPNGFTWFARSALEFVQIRNVIQIGLESRI